MVNGADQIYVERNGQIYPVNAAFTDDNHLRRTIEKIVGRVGRRIDESSPMVDARLPDGSRVNAVLPPVALDGPMLTIRKFAADPLTVQDLVDFGTMTAATANLLAACVRGKLNILISGGTGSGKTTLLNVLSSFVPSNERIVTIEDAAELQLRQEHVVRMESRPSNIEGRGEITTRDLVRNSLRMRPDRIIVGEVRDGAAVDMLQAMNTGHDGSLTTLHANSPRDALSRLETMVLMAGVELPTRAIREQAASAIDLIVHQSRLRDGTRRVTHITEVTGMESDVVTLQDLFLFDYAAGVDADGRSSARCGRPASGRCSSSGSPTRASSFRRRSSRSGHDRRSRDGSTGLPLWVVCTLAFVAMLTVGLVAAALAAGEEAARGQAGPHRRGLPLPGARRVPGGRCRRAGAGAPAESALTTRALGCSTSCPGARPAGAPAARTRARRSADASGGVGRDPDRRHRSALGAAGALADRHRSASCSVPSLGWLGCRFFLRLKTSAAARPLSRPSCRMPCNCWPAPCAPASR